jgi:hypothetical protein
MYANGKGIATGGSGGFDPQFPTGPKHERQLYVGNLPPTVNHTKLVELLNLALLAMKCNIHKGLPVLSAWIS